MDDVEEGECSQHGQGVQAILICLLVGNALVKTIRVLDESEYDPDLYK